VPVAVEEDVVDVAVVLLELDEVVVAFVLELDVRIEEVELEDVVEALVLVDVVSVVDVLFEVLEEPVLVAVTVTGGKVPDGAP